MPTAWQALAVGTWSRSACRHMSRAACLSWTPQHLAVSPGLAIAAGQNVLLGHCWVEA